MVAPWSGTTQSYTPGVVDMGHADDVLVLGPAFTEAIMEAPRASLRDCAVGELKICTGVVTIHVLQIAFGPAGLVMLTVRCAMKGATELCRNGYLARYLFFLRVR